MAIADLFKTRQPIETALGLYFTEAEKDVCEEISTDLLSFSFSDSETNAADSLSITLKDETGKWAQRWKPDPGERVKASIKKIIDGKVVGTLNCGKFFVDTMKVQGAPRTFEMGAVSIPLNKPIRKLIKSKAWEKTSLKKIASAISEEADIELLWDSESDPEYDRVDQKKESDLKMVSRLCDEAGLSIKVTDDKLVIFDQHSYENKKPVKTVTLGESDVLNYSFETSQSDLYKSVTVSYRSPKKKKKGRAGGYTFDLKTGRKVTKKKTSNPAVFTYTATDPEADENGQEYYLKSRCTSIDEAKRKATAMLRKLNRRGVTGDLTVVGDIDLVAGAVVAVKGFGIFDGNFIIGNAKHDYGSNGYITSIQLRRVQKGY
jgi:hypothetical protein